MKITEGDIWEVWYCLDEEWGVVEGSQTRDFEKALDFARNYELKNNPTNIRIYAYEEDDHVCNTIFWQCWEEVKMEVENNSCGDCGVLCVGHLDNGLCPMCNKYKEAEGLND